MDKIDQKQRFLDNNIPYNEIDAEMIDIIDVLNFKLGYKTKFCCYGHRKCEMSSIMFDTCVNDKMIYKLMKYLYKKMGQCWEFNKYARFTNTGKIIYNKEFKSYEFSGGNDVLSINWTWECRLGGEDFINQKKILMYDFYKYLCDFK